jgi:OPT family oligopeptide transporter
MTDETAARQSEAHEFESVEESMEPRELLPGAKHPDQMYVPAPGEKQLTLRAVIAGCFVGSVVACTNIYIGLKIGWSFGAAIISAVLGFAIFSALGKRLSVLETNITQTAGSAAGAMAAAAGLLSAIPAMQMLGHRISPWHLAVWSLSIAFLGVFFIVPLRYQMVEVERLRFPTGTATAETILAMFAEAAEAAAQAKVLLWAGVIAGLYALGAHFFHFMEQPPLVAWAKAALPGTAIAAAVALAAAWSFKIYFGPALFGAGFLIGPRVALSLMLGAIVAWGMLGPLAQSQGWVTGKIMSYADGPRGWILWPGVALMVSEALATLVFSWRTFVRALKRPTQLATVEKAAAGEPTKEVDPDAIPNAWWMGGLALGSMLTMVIAYLVFDIEWWMTLIAIALSAVLAIVAVRSTGETDINPIGGMGKVTQLVYGALAPGQIATNLMAAAITGAGASQAADMMQDLKTGHMLGASPRKQFVAQLVGIGAGVVFVVPVYFVFTSAYKLGQGQMPAPAAMAWKAMAELLAHGLGALPTHAGWAVLIAALAGIAMAGLRRVKRIAFYVPSGLACGIAFIIPAFYSMVMFFGLVAWWLWKKKNPTSVERFNFVFASGLIAGAGLMGIVNAVLTILHIGG